MTNLEIAAQLWCLPQHGKKVMDTEFAKSIALILDQKDSTIQALREEVERLKGSSPCIYPHLDEIYNLRSTIKQLGSLAQYFKRHGLTEESRKIVEEALANPVVREIMEEESENEV